MAEERTRPRYDAKAKRIDPPVVGCKTQMAGYADWLRKWKKGIGFVIFLGKSGCGKGVVAQVVAEALGWQVMEKDLSDIPPEHRDKKRSMRVQNHLVGQNNTVIVARGLDAALSGLSAISLIRNYLLHLCAQNPVVVISSSATPLDKSVVGISSKTIDFGVALPSEIAKFLQCVGIPPTISAAAAARCRGDVRNALISARFCMYSDVGESLDWSKDTQRASLVDSVHTVLRGAAGPFECESDEHAADYLVEIVKNSTEVFDKETLFLFAESMSEHDSSGIGGNAHSSEFFCLEFASASGIIRKRMAGKTSEIVAAQFKSRRASPRTVFGSTKKITRGEAAERLNRTKQFELKDLIIEPNVV